MIFTIYFLLGNFAKYVDCSLLSIRYSRTDEGKSGLCNPDSFSNTEESVEKPVFVFFMSPY